MPTESMIVVAGIVVVFVIFGIILAWANHRTTQ